MPVTIGIYKLIFDGGAVYIGQSWNIEKRIVNHKSSSFKGKNFSVVFLRVFKDCITQDILDYYEQFYMDVYRNRGVVLLNRREAGKGGRPSEDTKRKLSLIFKGRDNGRSGYVTPVETRYKISQTKMGCVSPRKGVVLSEVVRNRISQGRKNKMVGYQHPRRRGVVTKDGKRFPTITAAARAIGVKRTTLNAMLVGDNPNYLGVCYD